MKSKAELNKDAQKYLEQYKTQTIYATSDGQFFIEKNRAELHAKTKELSIYDFGSDGTADDTVINAETLPSPEFRATTEKELDDSKAENKATTENKLDDVDPQDNKEETEGKLDGSKAKDEAVKRLAELDDVAPLDYKEMVKLVNDLGLNPKDSKKATLIEALNEFKNQNNG